MSTAAAAIAAALAFTWLGMVLAISFLEAPLKFRAATPNIADDTGFLKKGTRPGCSGSIPVPEDVGVAVGGVGVRAAGGVHIVVRPNRGPGPARRSRMLQGFATAIAAPTALALLVTSFTDERQRAPGTRCRRV